MKLPYILWPNPYPPFEDRKQEVSSTVFFGMFNEIVDKVTMFGGATDVILPINEIIARGTRANVCRILLWHTHPSGNPTPSAQDISSTRALCIALRRHNLRLVDHLIFAGSQTFSFRANAML